MSFVYEISFCDVKVGVWYVLSVKSIMVLSVTWMQCIMIGVNVGLQVEQ